MGKPNPVLEIAVSGQWMTQPAVVALIEAGHKVTPYPGPLWPDLILHPAAGWHVALFEERVRKDGSVHYPYVDTALVRARKYHRERRPT